MSKIFVPAYWPFFKSGELRRFDYSNPEAPSFTSVFSYDKGSDSMLYNNYDSAGTWLNKWYYRYNPGFGVAEWRDDYPKGKKVVLSPPIGWGEFQEVGSTYIDYPKFDFLKCWPMAFSNGTQIVHFEEHISQINVLGVYYQDVIQFTYLQNWNGKPATGARYWMALGVGPIKTQFLTQDATDPTKITESVIWEAKITKVS
ncbi:MAG: hypothetical protein WCJ62_00140 [Flavobacterium sp.]